MCVIVLRRCLLRVRLRMLLHLLLRRRHVRRLPSARIRRLRLLRIMCAHLARRTSRLLRLLIRRVLFLAFRHLLCVWDSLCGARGTSPTFVAKVAQAATIALAAPTPSPSYVPPEDRHVLL